MDQGCLKLLNSCLLHCQDYNGGELDFEIIFNETDFVFAPWPIFYSSHLSSLYLKAVYCIIFTKEKSDFKFLECKKLYDHIYIVHYSVHM